MADENRIKDKFKLASKYLIVIEELNILTEEELEANIRLQLEAERAFEIVSQIILDICTHIVSTSPIQAPNSYAECIDCLVQLNIISSDEKDKFKALIRMRNLIVHQYGTINYNFLLHALKAIIGDFAYFQQQILTWLEKQDLNV